MSLATLTDQAVRDLCNSFAEGSRVKAKYFHTRDLANLRTLRGTISCVEDLFFTIRASTTGYIRLPSDTLLVISLESCSTTSATRDEAEDADRAPPQPAGERTTIQPEATQMDSTVSQLFDLFKTQAVATERQLQQIQRNHEEQLRILRDEMVRKNFDSTPQGAKAAGQDVESLIRISEAMKGSDNPQWRLCAGILLPRFLPEKFMIVSIPHLLFKEDPLTGEMIRLPKGTALINYKSMLSNCKLQFPNQMIVKTSSKNPKDDAIIGMTGEISAGVRAQIERAERMFTDLLTRIDEAKELPTTKSEWMIFIDAGASVLDLYSTLSNGFARGGGKLAQAYSKAISSTGRFDPVSLFQIETRQERHNDPFR